MAGRQYSTYTVCNRNRSALTHQYIRCLGAFGALFCIVWTVCVCDTPNEHKSISAAERKYIMQDSSQNTQKSIPIPWRSIMTSLVVWSLVVNTFAQLFITVALTTYLPLYIQLVLKKDLNSVTHAVLHIDSCYCRTA